MAKPRKTINWEVFDKLASYQCTQLEIAAFFDVSLDLIEDLCLRERGESLAEIWQRRRFFGKARLRKAQLEHIENAAPGWASMAIHLDKKIFPEEQPRPLPPEPPKENAPHESKSTLKTFEEFCETAGYPKPYPKQDEMRVFGFDEIDPRMLLGARGVGKTDYLTILGVAYEIYKAWKQGRVNEETNLLITKSKARNTAIIGEIASALKANGVPLAKENSSRIRVEGLIGKDDSVEAITIKTSMRGRHPKRVIMDDPVTEEDISEAMRILVKRKYNEVMKLCSNVLVIGQPAHQHDLYAELRPMVKIMLVPHGMIPELDHDLEAQRLAGVDEASIQASYFLKVITEGSTPFDKVKYLDRFPDGESVAFIDPSDGGDHTAVSVIKAHMDGVAVVGKQWKRAWYHCLDEMVPFLRSKGVRKVCFETNCTGRQPIGQLQQALGPFGIGVVGKHSDTNKHAVIMAAGSYAHMIHLSRESDRSYTDHVVQYEYKAKFDDAPDSLARGLEWIGLIRGKS